MLYTFLKEETSTSWDVTLEGRLQSLRGDMQGAVRKTQ